MARKGKKALTPTNLGKVKRNRIVADDIISVGRENTQNRVGMTNDVLDRLPGQTDRYFQSLKKRTKNIKLINLRKGMGYSQTAMAQIAGLSIRTYQNYENGERNMNNAPAEQLYKISITLGLPMEEFLALTDEEKEQLKKDIEHRKEVFDKKTT